MSGAFSSVPVGVDVFASLALMLLINWRLKNLLAAVLAAAVFLGFSVGFSTSDIFGVAWRRISSFDNIGLAFVVAQIIWFSSQLREVGVMRKLVSAVRGALPPRAAMASLPAAIGVLPMPGGAIFSAPLVDECDECGRVPADLKTRINYWFRHIWEYWWPLYPGVLLAVEITGVDLWKFIALQLPMTFAAVAIGWFFLVRRLNLDDGAGKKTLPADSAPRSGGLLKLLCAFSPILVVIAVYALVMIFLPSLAEINKYIPIALGIFSAMLFVQSRYPAKAGEWRRIILSMRVLKLVLLVEAVRVYGAFIESRLPDGVLLVERMRMEMAEYAIPAILIAMLIPFVSGVSTGLAIGFFGASFPIVMSLVGEGAGFAEAAPTIALAYACGYAGMLLSPVHICLLVTNEHFKTDLARSLAKLALPVGVLVLFALAYSLGLAEELPTY